MALDVCDTIVPVQSAARQNTKPENRTVLAFDGFRMNKSALRGGVSHIIAFGWPGLSDIGTHTRVIHHGVTESGQFADAVISKSQFATH